MQLSSLENLGVQVCWGQLRGKQVWLGPQSNFPPDFSPDCRRNSWWTESLQIFPVLKTGLCPNQMPPFPGCLVPRIMAAWRRQVSPGWSPSSTQLSAAAASLHQPLPLGEGNTPAFADPKATEATRPSHTDFGGLLCPAGLLMRC